jgi:Cof subfamily protein (haloacid dehalogenase superfamily)
LSTSVPSGPYRLIVADIDGTLLDSRSVLRPVVVDAVAHARGAGIFFTVATGRRYTTVQRVLTDLGLLEERGLPPRPHGTPPSAPVVLQTGAMVASADGSQVLLARTLPEADARQAITAVIDRGLQPILYENRTHDQRLFSGPEEYDSPGARLYLASNPHLVVRRPYVTLLDDLRTLQIAVIGDLHALEAVIPSLHLANCRTILSYSPNLQSHFLEVFRRDCSKGQAVQAVARVLGVTMDQVVCIGDNWNDVEMLSAAGCGVAVANAVDGIAPYARRRGLSNDQDAVAAVIAQVLAGAEPGEPNPLYRPDLAGHGNHDRAVPAL